MISSIEHTENIEYLNNLLIENPKSTASVKAAKYYLQNGDSKKAILLCEDSLNYFPEYLTSYLILINAHISNSDFSAAQSILQKANTIFPNHWAFKPILKVLDGYGFENNYSFSKIYSDESNFSPLREVEIDENDIDTIVEESKSGSIVDSFDIDNYFNEATIEEIDKPDAQTFDNHLNFPDEYLTINDFKPAENNFSAHHNEIIDSIISEHEEVSKEVNCKKPLPNVKNSRLEEGYTIKVFNDKYNLETELNLLLSEEDLQLKTLLPDSPYEEIMSEKYIPPKLISKTLAEVYETQGKYSEAIEIYNALLRNNEITSQECNSKILSLQERISESIDI